MPRHAGGDIDAGGALQALPGRHRVHLQHHEFAARILDQVDPGIIGADRGGGPHRDVVGRVVERGGAPTAPWWILVIQRSDWRIIAATALPPITNTRQS